MTCYAIVPCAGTGTRAGGEGPKQYRMLAGRPLVAHTLAALAAVKRLAATLVVLAPDDAGFDAALPGFEGARGWVVRRGGATRAASVAAGLDELATRGAAADDWVLVHDAARCLLRPEWVDALIDACAGDAVGGLLAQPLADTLKQAGADGRVAATVDRSGKWAAQTPQMFRLGLLRRALAAAGPGVTDEAAAVEGLGLAPRLVAAPLENFKLTWPADFELAERLLRARELLVAAPRAEVAAAAIPGACRETVR
ncbi:MAG: 2-C-methyl-D-erythritol 4-phosphate cytidylyltransferase [Burkholderiales bacterium]|nr:2-C-methyl-D-erythritol 4-phosphate cytidylyltransferase [Burkholderiales bacterium]